MKSFSSFIFLNVLILFAYAQDQTLPATTCEQNFALQGTTCTPCQQAIYKNGGSDASSFVNKKPPSNKCLFIYLKVVLLLPLLLVPYPWYSSVKDALDKTCADTTNNACSESDAKKD